MAATALVVGLRRDGGRGGLPWSPYAGAAADWQQNCTAGYETLGALLAGFIIMPPTLSFLNAD